MNGFFFQAEDGIRDAQESRGLGDVYKRQTQWNIRENNLFLPEGLQAKAFAFVDKGWFTVSVLSLIHI